MSVLWNKLGISQQPVRTTECEAGDEFILFLDSLDFDSAKKVCANNQATLARISNEEEHNKVVSMLLDFRNQEINFWIGNN